MKKPMLFVVFSLLSPIAFSQEPGQGTSRMPQAEQMQQMQARMQAMHEQMARIQATQDPEERSRLMQEHMQSMHQSMMMMGGMMGGSMTHGQEPSCQHGDVECRLNQMQTRQQMMGQHMGMMQQMMQHMMEQMMEGRASEAPEAEIGSNHH
jgi:hypothetical protein